jgi:hypothetical protein
MAPRTLAQQLAAQNATQAAAAPPTAAAAILTNAFVTAPGPKKQQGAEIETVNAAKIYTLSFGDRKLLGKGPKLQIVDAEGNFVTDMPIALFRATSTKKELAANITGSEVLPIKLPANLEPQMVKDLVQHLKNLTTWNKFAKDLQSYKSTYEDLHLCSAADYLGMTLYTQHIFNRYWALLRSETLPNYEDISAISAVQTPAGETLFRKIVNALAKLDVENAIPDPEDYSAYLGTNERFRVAVEAAKIKMQKHLDWVEKKTQRETEAKHQGDADKTGYQNRQAKWDAQKKKDAELAQRVQAKMAEPGKKKWTVEEAGYLRRVRGINVPI